MTHHPTPFTTWSPSQQDFLIYDLVKLQGQSQRQAASLLGISQATVSRVIHRIERWQAHAPDRAEGRLDPTERLRAARCQAYERNELLLATCLRIAQEIEGFTDVSKSIVQRSSYGGEEQHIRTQHATLDRTGTVARFLRLAFRINMEQLKLASLPPPPPANPLTDEELARFQRESAAIAAEFAKSALLRPFDSTPAEPSPTDRFSAASFSAASFSVASSPAEPPEAASQPAATPPLAPAPLAGEPMALEPLTPQPATIDPSVLLPPAAEPMLPARLPTLEPPSSAAPPVTAPAVSPIHSLNQMHHRQIAPGFPTPATNPTYEPTPRQPKKTPPPIHPLPPSFTTPAQLPTNPYPLRPDLSPRSTAP